MVYFNISYDSFTANISYDFEAFGSCPPPSQFSGSVPAGGSPPPATSVIGGEGGHPIPACGAVLLSRSLGF